MNFLYLVPHPCQLSEAKLLSQCRIEFTRRGGPGGQHRNKVESAVVLIHEPTQILAEASERRDQSQNRRVALGRLRRQLSWLVRSVPCPVPLAPRGQAPEGDRGQALVNRGQATGDLGTNRGQAPQDDRGQAPQDDLGQALVDRGQAPEDARVDLGQALVDRGQATGDLGINRGQAPEDDRGQATGDLGINRGQAPEDDRGQAQDDRDEVLSVSELWKSRCLERPADVSPEHWDYPTLVAESLDQLVASGWEMSTAARRLGVSTARLAKLLRADRQTLEWVNRHRKLAGFPSIR
jgi:hypothetical protein